MMVRQKTLCFAFIFFFLVSSVHANFLVEGIEQIAKQIVKNISKESTEELIKFGGEKAINRLLKKASQEGGQELVEKIGSYATKYGIRALKVIENAPRIYVDALDRLPPNLVKQALWAAEREPERVTKLLNTYGPEALETIAKFRGVGSDIVEKLGPQGIQISRKLSEEQAVILAKHLNEISKMDSNLKKQVLDTIISFPKRAIEILEKHPKVLATTAGVTTFIALREDILGSEEEINTSNGNVLVRKRGIIERLAGEFKTPISNIFFLIGIIIFLWGILKIWGVYRREKIKIKYEELKFRSNAEKLQKKLQSEDKKLQK